MVVGIVLLLIVAAGGGLYLWDRRSRQRREARHEARRERRRLDQAAWDARDFGGSTDS